MKAFGKRSFLLSVEYMVLKGFVSWVEKIGNIVARGTY